MIRLWSGEALRTGWAIAWRSWLPFEGLGYALLLTGLIPTNASKLNGRELLMFLVGLTVLPLFIVGVMFLVDRASKVVAKNHYAMTLTQFVGWEVLWRTWLVALAIGIPLELATGLFGALLKRSLPMMTHQLNFVFNAMSEVIRTTLLLISSGWALGQVLKRKTGGILNSTD